MTGKSRIGIKVEPVFICCSVETEGDFVMRNVLIQDGRNDHLKKK